MVRTLKRLLPSVCVLSSVLALAAQAQEEPAPPELAAPELVLPSLAAQAASGSIVGTVLDNTTAEPVAGVEVTLTSPGADGAAAPSEDTVVTDAAGRYEFAAVPEGTHALRFAKPGYRAARWQEFPVVPNQMNPGDFALAPESTATSPEGVEEIVVIGQMKAPEASRPDADEFINTMDTAEIGKFAASDIGDAIKRIAGINVVEGQFAIIRGLEDRYSSTLYNSAPVPSPDPDSQSVQLDLFPSEIASNLVVSKTFVQDLPSNSSGGSINVLTNQYPEDLELKVSFGSGFNSNAVDRFIEWHEGTPFGTEANGSDVIEGEVGASLGGKTDVFEREVSVKAVFNWELDYSTKEGVVEAREPRLAMTRLTNPPQTTRSGGLSLGILGLSGGRFDYTESDRVEQLTGSLDIGFDLDTEGNHPIHFAAFYTKKDEDVVQARENGFLPTMDYAYLESQQAAGQPIDKASDYHEKATIGTWVRGVRASALDTFDRGPLWFASVSESRTYTRSRDLQVYQLNGEHTFNAVEGLRITWAGNHATTNQDEGFFSARYFYEPANGVQSPAQFPTSPADLGPGVFATNGGIFVNSNVIAEKQNFVRADAEYEANLTEWLVGKAMGGLWYENASRDVGSAFLYGPSVRGSGQFGFTGATPQQLGPAIAGGLDRTGDDFSGTIPTSNESAREIFAWNLGFKATLWEDLDLLAGLRREQITIESRNTPFTRELAFDGSPGTFPSKYLLFDRLDNVATGETPSPPPPGTTFNDQLLGLDVPVDPLTGLVDLADRQAIEALVNGKIDETHTLPSAGLTYRPIDGLNLRAAYSKTIARPSFRELGYYVSVEPGSDDLVIGNPQLQLSGVESWDARVEYMWGDLGDLAALSLFFKTIQNPIESIVIRDPTNFEGTEGIYRTFFNNPNDAKLRGIELEARKAIDFVGVDALEYLSIAGNFTYIDAEVARPAIEISRAAGFFGVAPGDVEQFQGLAEKRRLYSQPEWIVNTDISFDHPDWGTKATLAFFGISDVLDSAGSAVFNGSGVVAALNLDRYVDSFYQLDLVVSQTFSFERLPGEFTLKGSLKNLTDSTRRLIYDPAQTVGEIAEREYKVGRDLSVSVSYSHAF